MQFLAVVLSPKYGVLDAFGFNSITEQDFMRVVDKFYNYQERYEIPAGVVKYLLNQAIDISYLLGEQMPYEYICWESILLDVEQEEVDVDIEKRDLSQKDIDMLCLSSYVQNWFYDEITSEEFAQFIDKLSKEYKSNNYSVDLDKFIADHYNEIYTEEELTFQTIIFNIAAYFRYIKNDIKLAEIFHSLDTNYAFLTNILRKYARNSNKRTKNMIINSNIISTVNHISYLIFIKL